MTYYINLLCFVKISSEVSRKTCWNLALEKSWLGQCLYDQREKISMRELFQGPGVLGWYTSNFGSKPYYSHFSLPKGQKGPKGKQPNSLPLSF